MLMETCRRGACRGGVYVWVRAWGAGMGVKVVEEACEDVLGKPLVNR